jgi:hypothetical protein
MCKEFEYNLNHKDQNKYQLFDTEKKADQQQGFFDFTVVDQVKNKDGSRNFIMRHHNEMTAPMNLGELRSKYKVAPIEFEDLTEENEVIKEANKHQQNKKPVSNELLQKVQRFFQIDQHRGMLYKKSIAEPGSLSENEQVSADIFHINYLRKQYMIHYSGKNDPAESDDSINRLIDSHTEQLKRLKEKNKESFENIVHYTENKYYDQMNKYLRKLNPNVSQEIKDMCDDVTDSLEGFRLEEDMTLTRHMGIDGLIIGLGLNSDEIKTSKQLFEAFGSMKVHRIINADKAFCSTSLKPQGASGFNQKQVECRILAPKGTRGACIRNISKYQNEDEVLLQTNTKLQLLGVIDDGEWVGEDKDHKIIKDRKIVVYLRAVPDEVLEMKDAQDHAALSERHQEDHKMQAAFMSSQYEISNSSSNMDLKASMFGYSSKTKGGQRKIQMKNANSALWSDAVNKVNNRCMMILGIYYSRNRDMSVLNGNRLKEKEIRSIQKEVEDALSDRSVKRKAQDKVSRLLLEMRAGIAVNMTSKVMNFFKDRSKSLDRMSSAVPYMQTIMLMQKAYDEISSSINNEEFRNRFKSEEERTSNEAWKKRLSNLSKCSRDHYDKLLSYRTLMRSSDPMSEQRNKGVNVNENPFGDHEANLNDAFKDFCM